MIFKHFLITRFNLKNKDWKLTKNNGTILDEEWLDHRFFLFKNYCLPSVVHQTNQAFSWLIYFDSSTPQNFREEIHSLLDEKENIEYFFVDGMDAFYPSLIKKIKEETANVPYLITSRIDNDDCLNRNYIETIQSLFNKQDFTVIDSVSGYTLQINPQYKIGKKEHIFNPFLTLIEKNDNPLTIWSRNHASWKKERNILRIRKNRLWMSIIHDKNVVNKFEGFGSVKWDDVCRNFIVSEGESSRIRKELEKSKISRIQNFINFINNYSAFYSKLLKKKIGVYNS